MGTLASAGDVLRLIAADSWRMAVLETVRALDLADCWVGAGFVRAVVWDHLHGHAEATPLDDVDVVFFDSERTDPAVEIRHEQRLAALWPADRPAVPWSVKNQARSTSETVTCPTPTPAIRCATGLRRRPWWRCAWSMGDCSN